MLPAIFTPDVELWAVGWVRSALAGRPESSASQVWVDRVTPNPRRARMVIVRYDGGPRVDLVTSAARLGVNVWAETEQDATDLARLVEGLLLSVRGVGPVSSVNSQSGPVLIADDQPRRYMTFELFMRGTES